MRLAVAATALLLSTTTVLAQPGPDQSYGPPPQPYPQPAPYAPPQPAPNDGAPQPAPPPQPAPDYGAPQTAPNYGAPQPAPQPYPQPQPAPYPQQPAPSYGSQPYAPQYAPRPYYAPQPYAQAPVGGLTRPAIREIKNPGTAQLLAVGATGLGLLTFFAAADDNNDELALVGAGLTLIGPSAGHIYAGENGHAVKMSLLRTGGLLTFIYGAAKSTGADCIDYCYENNNDESEAAMYLGGAVFVVGTLYDLYDSGRAARRFNEKAARALTIGPTMMSSAKGGSSPGVALSGSF